MSGADYLDPGGAPAGNPGEMGNPALFSLIFVDVSLVVHDERLLDRGIRVTRNN